MRILAWDLECSNLSGMAGRLLAACTKPIVPDVKTDIKVFRADDRKYRTSDLADDGKLAAAIRDELEKSDILVGHNSKLFDRKFLNARLVRAGERPLKQMFHIDTMWVIRTHLRATSRLQGFSEWIGTEEQKTPIHWDDWIRAHGFSRKALDEIVDHCERDVDVLEQVYWRLLPLIRSIRKDA